MNLITWLVLVLIFQVVSRVLTGMSRQAAETEKRKYRPVVFEPKRPAVRGPETGGGRKPGDMPTLFDDEEQAKSEQEGYETVAGRRFHAGEEDDDEDVRDVVVTEPRTWASAEKPRGARGQREPDRARPKDFDRSVAPSWRRMRLAESPEPEHYSESAPEQGVAGRITDTEPTTRWAQRMSQGAVLQGVVMSEVLGAPKSVFAPKRRSMRK